MDKKVIRAALLGFGTVGTGVYKVLTEAERGHDSEAWKSD